MTLPTFLGIGVARAGTSWLHAVLSEHPDVYVPTRRKEVRFFDRNHERGLSWYESFFCPSHEAHRYRAIGEISPQYFYCAECPPRIADELPSSKLILMLRHPVDRAYSHYGFVLQRRSFQGTFQDFLVTKPTILDKGFYRPFVDRWLQRFDRDRMLILVFEDVFRGGEDAARRAIASFLDVPAEGFPTSVGRINASSIPRFRSVTSGVVKAGRYLRKNNLDSVVDIGGRIGLRRILTKGRPQPRLDPLRRAELSRPYLPDFDELERLLGIDLSSWR